jgi:hypothetical protein
MMMIVKPQTASVSFDDGIHMIAFHTNAPETYIIIQLCDAIDEQDKALGMDGVYLEINDQSHGGYNAIEQISCASDLIKITFSAQKLGFANGEDGIQISMDLITDQAISIRNMLKLMAYRTGLGFTETT